MERRARTLDTVRLLRDWEGWPAGTIGAVVSEYSDSALVEVGTDAGSDARTGPERDLLDDLIAVPYGALDVVESAAAQVR